MLKVGIIGGGASGVFAGIICGEEAKRQGKSVQIQILEANSKLLRKVKISGGGRCNVTHHPFEVSKFIENYPRGKKELRSSFSQFFAKDMIGWLKDKGVDVHEEKDGRIFPITNESQTIINCFQNLLDQFNVKVCKSTKVLSISNENGYFKVTTNDNELNFDKILLATGSSSIGYELARGLGHSITDLAPSLFTFKIDHEVLKDLQGISLESVKVDFKNFENKFLKLSQTGPMVITHWGVSGPAILKLSAFAARELKEMNYQGHISVSWFPNHNHESLLMYFNQVKTNNPKNKIKNRRPKEIPSRLWENIVDFLNISPEKNWNEISKKEINRLVEMGISTNLKISGKSRFKDEFVECGGVDLKEISLKTMESKLQKGLFFAGELMDIDGITGGFNFQHAWTSGWIAGHNMLK